VKRQEGFPLQAETGELSGQALSLWQTAATANRTIQEPFFL